jgi:hypothetical protein
VGVVVVDCNFRYIGKEKADVFEDVILVLEEGGPIQQTFLQHAASIC